MDKVIYSYEEFLILIRALNPDEGIKINLEEKEIIITKPDIKYCILIKNKTKNYKYTLNPEEILKNLNLKFPIKIKFY
jgi:hypothetical protein